MAIPIETRLRLNSSDVDKGVTRAKAKLGDLKKSAMGVGSAVSGAFAAIGAAATVRAVRRWAEEFDRIGKLATRLDETPEAIQRISYAAKLAGSDTEIIVNAMTRLTRKATDLENSGIANAFKELGIAQKAFIQLSAEDKLATLADAFTTAEDRGTAFRHLFTLLEDDAKQLIPLFEQGGASIKATMESATVATAEQVREAERLNDALTTLENSTVGLKATMTQFFADTINGWKAMIAEAKGEEDAYLKAFYPDLYARDQAQKRPQTDAELEAAENKRIGDIFRAALARQPQKSNSFGQVGRSVGNDDSAAKWFDFLERKANGAKAARANAFDTSLKAIGLGIAEAQAQRDALNPMAIVANSMRAIGGGGAAVGFDNPQIRKLDQQIRVLQKQATLLEQIKNKDLDMR